MEKKKSSENLNIKAVISGLICGVAAICVLLLLCALLMSFGILPITMSNICSSVSLGIGSMLAGLVAAKKLQKNGLLIGLATGAVIFLIFTLISLIGVRSAPSFSTLFKAIICAAAGCIGGILGVNSAGKRKII